MRIIDTILCLLLISTGVFGQQKLLNKARFYQQPIDNEWVLVKLKPEKKISFKSTVRPLAHSKEDDLLENVVKVKVPQGADPIDFCNQLRKKGNVVYADPIMHYELLAVPSDPLIGNQYYLEKIKAFEAWDITHGDDDLTIGIIDTGLDLDHEDILNNLWINTNDPIDGMDNDNNGYVDDYYGYDFADNDNDPGIQNSNHGMIVGGIASAATNNGKGIAGVGYNTKVAALKGFTSVGGFSGGLYEAITYAAENGMDVLNLSWGRMGEPLQSEQDIIEDAVLNHNVVIVAAAGNEGGKPTEENLFYPASYDHVLSVGGSDANDNKSSGSTFNYAVDLIAPGVSMFSTVNGNGYADGGPGTSYAAPQVAGAAALVRSVFPELSAVQVMERIRSTADDVYDIGSNAMYEGKLGKGRLNVFRAVSEKNVKSMRASAPVLHTSHQTVPFYGDSVRISTQLTNYLSPIISPTLTLSSPDENFTPLNATLNPGYLGTLDTTNIVFDVVLSENLPPASTVAVRIDFADAGYDDFQFLTFETAPDYHDFGNENVRLTISGDGDLGLIQYSPPIGLGFEYQLEKLMDFTGLIIATDSTSVSDNVISSYDSPFRDQDFLVSKFYKRYHHPAADFFGYSEFTDTNHPIHIEQLSIAWQNEDFLIIRYRLVNTTAIPIDNVSVGIFADWNLDADTANRAVYDRTNDLAYVTNAAQDVFAGIKLLGGDVSVFSMLDMETYQGNLADVSGAFTDRDKYDFLVVQNIDSAGTAGSGNDVATLSGKTLTQLDAYGEAYVNVIYAVSGSFSSLVSEIQQAETHLNDFILKPRVLDTFFTCDGSFTIDPEEGTLYDFFTDPLAQNLIASDTSLAISITSDTVFYVKNKDQNYPSDIFQIRVKLFTEIADFAINPDTLYLDHPITNVVQFSDLSLDPISWHWDFGEGTSSMLQHPNFSFSAPGIYPITLTISNAQGCVDTLTKNLVVANRPNPPSFPPITICAGDEITLTDPAADKLNLYRFSDQTHPNFSNETLIIGNIEQDTTLYVSGTYASFESEKVPVFIDVLEVPGHISMMPDTTSIAHQIVIAASDLSEGSGLDWTVDGISSGTSASITLPAIAGQLDVLLEITSTDGCVKTISKTYTISTSPFAAHNDVVSCNGDTVVLRPENGTYFGFYADPGLNELLKKGTTLATSGREKVYVVGLDDGLPGMPIEVAIEEEDIVVDIVYSVDTLQNKFQVNFSVASSHAIDTYRWYLDGTLLETVSSPTFFLNARPYEIVAEVSTTEGCTQRDTLLIDLTPPLGVSENESKGIIYPNPSKGFISIIHPEKVIELRVISLTGKLVHQINDPTETIDLSHLPSGTYILRLKASHKETEQVIILQ